MSDPHPFLGALFIPAVLPVLAVFVWVMWPGPPTPEEIAKKEAKAEHLALVRAEQRARRIAELNYDHNGPSVEDVRLRSAAFIEVLQLRAVLEADWLLAQATQHPDSCDMDVDLGLMWADEDFGDGPDDGAFQPGGAWLRRDVAAWKKCLRTYVSGSMAPGEYAEELGNCYVREQGSAFRMAPAYIKPMPVPELRLD